MKSQRAYQFLVVLLLILPARIFSQQEMPRIEQISPHPIKVSPDFYRIAPGYLSNEQTEIVHNSFYKEPVDRTVLLPFRYRWSNQIEVIKQNFYTKHVSFFCRKELDLEKITCTPVRFRLGSLEYVDKMEGKNRRLFISQ
jgi:hypothetical protein